MIYTVFPKDDSYIPQDFSTMEEAEDYKQDLELSGVDSVIESTEGEVI